MTERRAHWENVYGTKQPHEVSWTQAVPQTSLDFIHNTGVAKDAAIIDVGGGDSRLADCLLAEGYTNITVLDISEKALLRAQQRLGSNAAKVQWVVSDVTEFAQAQKYDVWHDRAAFHFLTTEAEVQQYRTIVASAVKGFLIIGAFSDKGPKKCSGLDITQYTEDSLSTLLRPDFEKINCLAEDHTTPFNTKQNFLFCCYRSV